MCPIAHPRESGDPVVSARISESTDLRQSFLRWFPAFAGMSWMAIT